MIDAPAEFVLRNYPAHTGEVNAGWARTIDDALERGRDDDEDRTHTLARLLAAAPIKGAGKASRSGFFASLPRPPAPSRRIDATRCARRRELPRWTASLLEAPRAWCG